MPDCRMDGRNEVNCRLTLDTSNASLSLSRLHVLLASRAPSMCSNAFSTRLGLSLALILQNMVRNCLRWRHSAVSGCADVRCRVELVFAGVDLTATLLNDVGHQIWPSWQSVPIAQRAPVDGGSDKSISPPSKRIGCPMAALLAGWETFGAGVFPSRAALEFALVI